VAFLDDWKRVQVFLLAVLCFGGTCWWSAWRTSWCRSHKYAVDSSRVDFLKLSRIM
jgi:hypothetical protein